MSTLQILFETFEGRVILGVTWIWLLGLAMDAMMRRSSAHARCQLWFLILVAAIGVPLVSTLTPSWRTGIWQVARLERPEAVVTSAIPESRVPGADVSPAASTPAIQNIPDRTLPAARDVEVNSVVTPSEATLAERLPIRRNAPDSSLPLSTRAILLGVWLGGVVISCLLLVRDYFLAARVLKRGLAMESPAAAALIARQLGLNKLPKFLESEAACAPACVGILRPVVLLPRQWRQWSEESRRGVLAHEFAHLVRGDLLIQGWSLLMRAVLWWHPISWWAHRRILVERERAADDLAREACERPSIYAAALLEAAQGTIKHIPALAISISGPTPLEYRVRRVLDDSAPRGRVTLKFTFGLALILAIFGFGGSILSPFGAGLNAQEPVSNVVATRSQEPGAAKIGAPVVRFDEVEVTGIVLNPDGTAARGATVSTRVYGPSSLHRQLRDLTATTEKDGRFSLRVHRSDLPNLALLAVSSNQQAQCFANAPFGAKAGSDYWRELSLKLDRAKQIQARVIDSDNNPVAGAKAWLWLSWNLAAPKPMESDERGNITFLVPQDANPSSLFAAKEGVGFDYADFNARRTRFPSPVANPDMAMLRLAKLVEIPVKVLDQDGKAISGAVVHPNFRRPGRDAFVLREEDLPEPLFRKTNDQGDAVVSVPFDVDEPVAIAARFDRFVPVNRPGRRYAEGTNKPTGDLWNPSKPESVTVTMVDPRRSLVLLRGRVVDKNGAGIADAVVSANGEGFAPALRFHSDRIYTDSAGSFEMPAVKNTFYLLTADANNGDSTRQTIAVGVGPPNSPITLQVSAPKRVVVRAIDAATAEPAINSQVLITLTTGDEYHKRYVVGGERPLLAGGASAFTPSPRSIIFRGFTNDRGELSAVLPSGRYEAQGFADGIGQRHEHAFSIDANSQLAAVEVFTGINRLAGATPPVGIPFKGVVVDSSGTPVEGATLTFNTRLSFGLQPQQAVTDSNGAFQLDRDPRLTLIDISSKDRRLVARGEIFVRDEEVKLTVMAAGKVIGRLIDGNSKAPLGGQTIEAHSCDYSYRPAPQAAATFVTDDQGRFELTPLVAQQTYRLWLKLAKPRNGMMPVAEDVIIGEPGQTLDLKEILVTYEN